LGGGAFGFSLRRPNFKARRVSEEFCPEKAGQNSSSLLLFSLFLEGIPKTDF